MRKFGLIGGTSWHSTVAYYATINKLVNEHYGDNTNPPLRIASLNQHEIHRLQRADDWDAIAEILLRAAVELQQIGVRGIALCANTPHKLFDRLQRGLSVPILHIADAIGAALRQGGWETVGLLGTRFTMTEDFIKGRLAAERGVEVLVPPAADQAEIQDQIYSKLSYGMFGEEPRRFLTEHIERLAEAGAEAVILGCTELPLLMKGASRSVPLVDSLNCHCTSIVRYILDDQAPEQPDSPGA